jgi:hypothetical protein
VQERLQELDRGGSGAAARHLPLHDVTGRQGITGAAGSHPRQQDEEAPSHRPTGGGAGEVRMLPPPPTPAVAAVAATAGRDARCAGVSIVCMRPILTEIYLCHACSCHEISTVKMKRAACRPTFRLQRPSARHSNRRAVGHQRGRSRAQGAGPQQGRKHPLVAPSLHGSAVVAAALRTGQVTSLISAGQLAHSPVASVVGSPATNAPASSSLHLVSPPPTTTSCYPDLNVLPISQIDDYRVELRLGGPPEPRSQQGLDYQQIDYQQIDYQQIDSQPRLVIPRRDHERATKGTLGVG